MADPSDEELERIWFEPHRDAIAEKLADSPVFVMAIEQAKQSRRALFEAGKSAGTLAEQKRLLPRVEELERDGRVLVAANRKHFDAAIREHDRAEQLQKRCTELEDSSSEPERQLQQAQEELDEAYGELECVETWAKRVIDWDEKHDAQTLPELLDAVELELNAEHERAVQAERERDELKGKLTETRVELRKCLDAFGCDWADALVKFAREDREKAKATERERDEIRQDRDNLEHELEAVNMNWAAAMEALKAARGEGKGG